MKDGESVPRHAHLPDLRPLGFKVLQPEPHRIVQLGRRKFSEGRLEAKIEALRGAVALERLRLEAAKKDTGGKLEIVK